MARPETLQSLLHKLQRINALLGSSAAANLAADIAAINTTNTTMETRLGTAAVTSVTQDIADIQTVLNAVTT